MVTIVERSDTINRLGTLAFSAGDLKIIRTI
jgi:hypothetical protein